MDGTAFLARVEQYHRDGWRLALINVTTVLPAASAAHGAHGAPGAHGAEAPAGEAPAGEAPAGEAPAGEAPAGEAPAGEAAAVAALPMGGPGVFEIAWGFARDREFETIREQIEAGTTVPSISEFFGAAFLYENEIRELFGINVTGIGVDLKGQLYKTSTRVPFSHAAVKARLAALAAAPVKPS